MDGLYRCDPEKNVNCKKNNCCLYNGTCEFTTEEEYKMDDDKMHPVYAMRFAVLQKQIENLVKCLEDVQQHIQDKVRKSMEADWGISENRSDRLMTETIIELQLIENKINEGLESRGAR